MLPPNKIILKESSSEKLISFGKIRLPYPFIREIHSGKPVTGSFDFSQRQVTFGDFRYLVKKYPNQNSTVVYKKSNNNCEAVGKLFDDFRVQFKTKQPAEHVLRRMEEEKMQRIANEYNDSYRPPEHPVSANRNYLPPTSWSNSTPPHDPYSAKFYMTTHPIIPSEIELEVKIIQLLAYAPFAVNAISEILNVHPEDVRECCKDIADLDNQIYYLKRTMFSHVRIADWDFYTPEDKLKVADKCNAALNLLKIPQGAPEREFIRPFVKELNLKEYIPPNSDLNYVDHIRSKQIHKDNPDAAPRKNKAKVNPADFDFDAELENFAREIDIDGVSPPAPSSVRKPQPQADTFSPTTSKYNSHNRPSSVNPPSIRGHPSDSGSASHTHMGRSSLGAQPRAHDSKPAPQNHSLDKFPSAEPERRNLTKKASPPISSTGRTDRTNGIPSHLPGKDRPMLKAPKPRRDPAHNNDSRHSARSPLASPIRRRMTDREVIPPSPIKHKVADREVFPPSPIKRKLVDREVFPPSPIKRKVTEREDIPPSPTRRKLNVGDSVLSVDKRIEDVDMHNTASLKRKLFSLWVSYKEKKERFNQLRRRVADGKEDASEIVSELTVLTSGKKLNESKQKAMEITLTKEEKDELSSLLSSLTRAKDELDEFQKNLFPNIEF